MDKNLIDFLLQSQLYDDIDSSQVYSNVPDSDFVRLLGKVRISGEILLG